jgi:hypothetical protein
VKVPLALKLKTSSNKQDLNVGISAGLFHQPPTLSVFQPTCNAPAVGSKVQSPAHVGGVNTLTILVTVVAALPAASETSYVTVYVPSTEVLTVSPPTTRAPCSVWPESTLSVILTPESV